jgi:hypothetical protein
LLSGSLQAEQAENLWKACHVYQHGSDEEWTTCRLTMLQTVQTLSQQVLAHQASAA